MEIQCLMSYENKVNRNYVVTMSNSELSLAEAIEKTGVSRNTLIRAIKSGRMSGSKNEHGEYRVDAAELFRVFEPVSAEEGTEESKTHSEARSPTIEKLYQRLVEKDEEISDLHSELDDKEEALNELRAAYNLLPSPEDVKAKIKAAIAQTESEKLKEIAIQKQQAEKWKKDLEIRQREIHQARTEAETLRQQATNDIAKIERRAAQERAIREALEKRGLLDRILNRKPKLVRG